jgi:hypothetical protein
MSWSRSSATACPLCDDTPRVGLQDLARRLGLLIPVRCRNRRPPAGVCSAAARLKFRCKGGNIPQPRSQVGSDAERKESNSLAPISRGIAGRLFSPPDVGFGWSMNPAMYQRLLSVRTDACRKPGTKAADTSWPRKGRRVDSSDVNCGCGR